MEMGANRFVTKPYDFSEVLSHIEALLKSVPTGS
jgi:DNA-binding response OmpR family regulator